MDYKSKFGQINWGRLTDGQNDGGSTSVQEHERSKDSASHIHVGVMKNSSDPGLKGQMEVPRFQGQGHLESIGQNRQQMKIWVPEAENTRESRDSWSVGRARPRIKVQNKIQFPSEEEDLDNTISYLRLFKDLGYTDFEIAFGYCNQSQELITMLCEIQSFQRSNLEEFFNVLRERRPVDLNKVIREFFNKRQDQNEDEGALMAYLKRKYYLMHGELAGQLDRPILREGEKLLLRHQFITALKDDAIKLELRVSQVSFEDLPSKARDLRKAQEVVNLLARVTPRAEQDYSNVLSTEYRKNAENEEARTFEVVDLQVKKRQGHSSFLSFKKRDDVSRTCKVKENLLEKHQGFKTSPETRVAKFRVFNLGKLKYPSRIPSIFNPEPDFIYEPGKPEGYILFQDGQCAHSIIENMKNPSVRRAIGKIQFWPLRGSLALKVAESFTVRSIK